MRTPPPAPTRKKWRKRLALAAVLATAAVLAGMLPAAASNGTIWTSLPSMPTARRAPASAAAPCPPGQAGTCVYTVGGQAGTSQVATIESYNRITNAWSTLPPMPTRRSHAAAVAAPCPPGQSGTCVYVIGGLVTEGETATFQSAVESYNPVTNAWSILAPLRTPRSGLAAAAAPCPPGQSGTCVYAVGGSSNAAPVTGLAESYNPANNAWSTVATMPVPRALLGSAAAACPPGQQGTCVYAVGGFDTAPTTAVHSYNPATNVWSPVAPLPVGRWAAGTAASTCPPGQSGVCVYTMGGVNLSSVQSYNPASNLWTDLPPMPTPRTHLAAAAMQCPTGVAGNCVYATGGVADQGVVSGALEALDPPDRVQAADVAEQPQED
ncbi:Kelch repeat-containing protein [Streptomyces sp. NPDC101118]|uniref:Kelch repeat-containing protein n=1 Tax=Streptomyces sp. NPDC101118 TaxID=3366109 RepID=UPI0038293253